MDFGGGGGLPPPNKLSLFHREDTKTRPNEGDTPLLSNQKPRGVGEKGAARRRQCAVTQ